MKLIRQWVHLFSVVAVLVVSEIIYRVVTIVYWLFPFPKLLDKIYDNSRGLRRLFRFHLNGESETPYQWKSTPDIIRGNGYPIEEHSLETEDGFVLVLHRIPRGKNEAKDEAQINRPAVLLLHGLFQNSETFVMEGSSLAFYLADHGYDVWLGNNRGTKYSHKHLQYKPSQQQYWDFSIDELARHDVPSFIKYIIQTTGAESLSYVGFSQGTAQAFASFAHFPELSTKVNMFVALSPAAKTPGLSKSVLSTLVSTNLEFIYLIFGKKAMFTIVPRVQSILSREMFVKLCDMSMYYLFRWKNSGMSAKRKPMLYAHIYDTSSVKCVEHWFQLIGSGELSMYQDEQALHGHRVPVRYDLSKIACKMALFYGGKDSLIEVNSLINTHLPSDTLVKCIDNYEHVDLLWADDVEQTVYQSVLKQLDNATKKSEPSMINTNVEISNDEEVNVGTTCKSANTSEDCEHPQELELLEIEAGMDTEAAQDDVNEIQPLRNEIFDLPAEELPAIVEKEVEPTVEEDKEDTISSSVASTSSTQDNNHENAMEEQAQPQDEPEATKEDNDDAPSASGQTLVPETEKEDAIAHSQDEEKLKTPEDAKLTDAPTEADEKAVLKPENSQVNEENEEQNVAKVSDEEKLKTSKDAKLTDAPTEVNEKAVLKPENSQVNEENGEQNVAKVSVDMAAAPSTQPLDSPLSDLTSSGKLSDQIDLTSSGSLSKSARRRRARANKLQQKKLSAEIA